MSDRYSSNARIQDGKVSNFKSSQVSSGLKSQADNLLSITTENLNIPHDGQGDQKPRAKMLLTEFASFGGDAASKNKNSQKAKKPAQNLTKKTFDYSSRKQEKLIVAPKSNPPKDLDTFIENDLNLPSSSRIDRDKMKNKRFGDADEDIPGDNRNTFRENVGDQHQNHKNVFGPGQRRRARSKKESPQRLLNNKLLVFNSSSQASEHFKIMYYIQMRQKEPNLGERRLSDVPNSAKSSIVYFPSASSYKRKNIKAVASSQDNLVIETVEQKAPQFAQNSEPAYKQSERKKISETINSTHENQPNRTVKPISFPVFNKTFNQEKSYKVRTLMNRSDLITQLPKVGETLRNLSTTINSDSADIPISSFLKREGRYNHSKKKDQEFLAESDKKSTKNVSFSQRRNSDMMFGDSHFNLDNASNRTNHENMHKFLLPSGSDGQPNLDSIRPSRHAKLTNRTRSKKKELQHALDLFSTQGLSPNTSKTTPHSVKQKNYLSFVNFFLKCFLIIFSFLKLNLKTASLNFMKMKTKISIISSEDYEIGHLTTNFPFCLCFF